MKINLYLNDNEYISIVNNILNHPVFLEMDSYKHHGKTTTMQHCIYVSYLSYKLSKRFHLNYEETARAALLHDLFLYDWHSCRKESKIFFHGFSHPKAAMINAEKYFPLSDKEKDIILKHMWPLCIIPPKSAEGFIVTFYDKYCSLFETLHKMKAS
jgi:uncharacterized protein